MKFHKYHGLGNDYIVLDPDEIDQDDLSEDQIRLICHRNFGIGSDGILLGPLSNDSGKLSLRIFNPDGSEAEKSGNGLRIFSRYLWDIGRVGTDPISIKTSGGDVVSQVRQNGATITVDMGRVSFNSRDIPVSGAEREVLQEPFEIDNTTLTFCAATIGNPHCVILREQALAEEARMWGPIIEVDPRFPNRTNVQFMEVVDRSTIKLEIWERGAGYTLASGSSSSAAGAVAKKLGLCDETLTVQMPGGVIELHLDDDYAVTMTGPVLKIGDGVIAAEMFRQPLD
jgi:diaminopimelate epimerase